MLQKPQIKAHFHVEIVKGEGVFLISEVGHSVLNGRLFELVTPLIDGRRTTSEIVDELQSRVSAAEVYYALTLLEKKGYVVEAGWSLGAGEAAYWSIQNLSPEMAAVRLAEAQVCVTAFGQVPLDAFVTCLGSLRVSNGEAGRLGIVLTDDYLRTELQAYNQEALRRARPWMLIKPVGAQILIGPVFYPGRTGCWECLAQRLRMNRSVEIFIQQKQNCDEPFPIPVVGTAATQHAALGIAASEVAKWIVGGETSEPECNIFSIDILTWCMQPHALMRLPGCRACGEPVTVAEEQAKPVELESHKKTLTEDGGHRVVGPEETLKRYARHVSPITGAVRVLARHFVANDGVMHVYIAGDNFAAPHHNLKSLQRTLRSQSSGKGITDLQARTSALCEALERYSGVFQGTEIQRKARLKDLSGLGIHPNDCMLFSERQYRHRDIINEQADCFGHVPVPFDDMAEIAWTPVWSLTHKLHRYLPTEYCYYGYPIAANKPLCICCSNGNAAGNTLEEAVLQGFFELVERDSVALWWYNRVSRPGVDLDSFNEPYLAKLRSALGRRHVEFWALDLTSDLGVPVFGALSRRVDQSEEHIVMGFGAHLDPRIALLRAVTELNQMLVWLFRVDNSEVPETVEHDGLLNWLKTATIANQRYLVPDEKSPRKVAADYSKRWSDDLREDVLFCQELVERRGMEMLVLDQTRPDIGLPVVKVIVPALRHFWARFAPGRLYDVPVALGWLNRSLTEEQLNPVPMFL
jgi:bacteriocin biosynthesis cyclodehydratase domain-containing protein